jgi:hypothetical protein
MHPKVCTASIGIFLLCFTGCASRQVGAHELSSDFREVASFAAETALFIKQIQAGRLTRAFAGAHTAYLADEVSQARKKFEKAAPAPGLEQTLAECRRQQTILLDELKRLPDAFNDPLAFSAVQERIDRIRREADQARARL